MRQEGMDHIVENWLLLLLLLPNGISVALALALSFCPGSALHF